MTTYNIIYYSFGALMFLTMLFTGFKIKDWKIKVNEKRKFIYTFSRNWTIGTTICVAIMLPIQMQKMYYESDDYLQERKLEVLNSYKNGNVELRTNSEGNMYNLFVPTSDDYFDEVTISNHDKNTPPRVIFWADRSKTKGFWGGLKWDAVGDFGFELKDDPIDREIMSYFLDHESQFLERQKEEMEEIFMIQSGMDSIDLIQKEQEILYKATLDSLKALPEYVKVKSLMEKETFEHQKKIQSLEDDKKVLMKEL